MSNKKISELPNSGAITGAEEVPVVQSGSTVKTTINTIKTFVGSQNLQQVTDNGSSTNHGIQFIGNTDNLLKVDITPTDLGAGTVRVFDAAENAVVIIDGVDASIKANRLFNGDVNTFNQVFLDNSISNTGLQLYTQRTFDLINGYYGSNTINSVIKESTNTFILKLSSKIDDGVRLNDVSVLLDSYNNNIDVTTGTFKKNGVEIATINDIVAVNVNTIGALINGSTAATPNDTDLLATADTSVLKKITWLNAKAFLKTYFDTIYTTTTSVASQITTALSGYLTSAVAAATYKFFGRTTVGNANYSVFNTDAYVTTSATFTAPRTWTLPNTSSVGQEIIIADDFQTVTSTNTLTIAVQTGKYLNGVLNGTEVIQSAGGHRRLFSDGSGNYSFDAGIVRQSKSQTLSNKTLDSTNVATTQTQGDNSTKIATTSYVDTGLNTKLNTTSGAFCYAPIKSNVTIAHTGTTAETKLFSVKIPAGTMNANDILEYYASIIPGTGTGNKTVKVYLNTSDAVGGTQIAAYTFGTTSLIFKRRLTFKNSLTSQEIIPGGTTSTANTDTASYSVSNVSTISANFNNDVWFVLSITLVVGTDNVSIYNIGSNVIR